MTRKLAGYEQEILKLHASGYSKTEIAYIYEVSMKPITAILGKTGIIDAWHYRSAKKRIFAKYKLLPNGCWEWMGATTNSGYGHAAFMGKVTDVHRISYLVTKGKIPDGMYVCHHCDNKLCINPDHLFLGTNSDNIKDYYSKNIHKARLLTKDQVFEIYRWLYFGGVSQSKLAKQLNVSQTTISQIWRGKTYPEFHKEYFGEPSVTFRKVTK